MHASKDSMWWVQEEIFWGCMGSEHTPKQGKWHPVHVAAVWYAMWGLDMVAGRPRPEEHWIQFQPLRCCKKGFGPALLDWSSLGPFLGRIDRCVWPPKASNYLLDACYASYQYLPTLPPPPGPSPWWRCAMEYLLCQSPDDACALALQSTERPPVNVMSHDKCKGHLQARTCMSWRRGIDVW
jgi:hypothetical protein